MKRVSDMIFQNENIEKIKSESQYALLKEKTIQDFLKQHHLDASIMEDYWVEFLDYNDDFHICQSCQGLAHCPKDTVGMQKVLRYYDGQVVLELQSCPFGKALEEKRQLLDHFIMSNVSEELMLTDLSSLEMIRNPEGLSPLRQQALVQILKYSQSPSTQGLFLHGPMGVGKTTLLAGLMNSLAKKDKQIGFIHFPTYLIDLKASFSSGDNEYAMDRLLKVDYLFLDELGEENITAWSRDEILLTILSYRLLNHLPTFLQVCMVIMN
ncbi:ATP-binding protein [Allocoprobacillus halotolerans]|uniref:ATP-binding protein n=1 Tax=Allocoprobacillus halotolerans TaxID=2944914 RepID=A0ABY5HYN3_9FIRM|nr:ATP-binding protein [Allocoprobacillus halotolerans]UTY38198.1 ATP-binding protein [Allocoprobacillus halotolerans]